MRIFISWSGNGSKSVAKELRSWLCKVIQAARPWMSEEDIEKGSNWSVQLNRELENTEACIVCLTPENIQSQWMHFEAGQATNSLGRELVCPYLVGVRKVDITGPFSQFQCTSAEKEDTLKLLHSINNRMKENPLDKEVLEDAFYHYWDEFERKLESVAFQTEPKLEMRSNEQLLGEILEKVRDIDLNIVKPQNDKDELTRRLAHLLWQKGLADDPRDNQEIWFKAMNLVKDLF